MQIREPKYKKGDVVYWKAFDCKTTIVKLAYYSFEKDTYYYKLKLDWCELEKEVSERVLEPCIEKPKSVWDLKDGDEFYVLNEFGVFCEPVEWTNDEDCIEIRKNGNAFLTREDAKFEAKRRQIENEMLRLGGRRTFDKNGGNYCIGYSKRNDEIDVFNAIWSCECGAIYFDTLKLAENAVSHIGVKTIKKHILGEDD